MGLNEKELVFKVHWAEKLKMVFKLIYIPLMLFNYSAFNHNIFNFIYFCF